LRDARSRLREVHRAIAPGVRERVDRLAHCRPAAHHVVNRTAGCHVPWRPDAAREQPPPPGRTPRLGQGWPGGASPRVVRGAPRPFATSSVTLGPDRRFRSLRHIDRWEVRMPGCVGEWDHHRYGRSSKQFLPRSWRSKRDGLSPFLRTSGVRGLTSAPRRLPRCSTRSRPFSACLRPCDGPPRGFGERGGRKWARNSPKLRAGRYREAAGRAASNLNVRAIAADHVRRAATPQPLPGRRPGEGSFFEPQPRWLINSKGIAADHLRSGNAIPPRPTSPGVRGPGSSGGAPL
jgi:hypothetical protein